MRELKVSVGVWYLGATSDRFVKEGYRPDRTMEERFKLAGSTKGVGGLEMHYPTEVTDDTYKSLKALADDLGLKIVQFCPHLWVDPRWEFGQFSNPDPKLRREAIDLAKRTTDIAQYMEAEIMVYWPAQDGFDYPFQADHRKRLDDLVEGLAEWADYNPDQKVVVEYKAFEPRTHIMLPTIGHCMTIINEINRPNLGINTDMGHALRVEDERIRADLQYLKVGKGKYFTFFRPYHLWFLEAPISVARAHLYRQTTLVPLDWPVAEVMTVAKRALKPGERLDDFGGFMFYGVMDRAEEARALNALPVGLAPGAEVVRPVAAGEVVTWDDVRLDEDSVVVKLRRQQDAL